MRANDGYYSFMMAIPTQALDTTMGVCIFRSTTLGDPTSWRAWDGTGFNLRMASPYVTGIATPVCASVGGLMVHSHFVYDTYLERYLSVAPSPGPLDVNGRPTCGFFYALSSDLIHWSAPGLLVEASLDWCAADPSQPGVLEPVIVAYPSIVDHADTTVNFEKAGPTPYFYYVRINGDNLDRDVVRVPLTLRRTNWAKPTSFGRERSLVTVREALHAAQIGSHQRHLPCPAKLLIYRLRSSAARILLGSVAGHRYDRIEANGPFGAVLFSGAGKSARSVQAAAWHRPAALLRFRLTKPVRPLVRALDQSVRLPLRSVDAGDSCRATDYFWLAAHLAPRHDRQMALDRISHVAAVRYPVISAQSSPATAPHAGLP